ncbi:hypothetical protein B0O40_1458 [Ruminococcaceae bacterium R-25]|nr:hypothetical protein B0O40_1458 [Ruminococcaceae bacterium R-25]SUQ12074.1 hypothetical protein SAMN06297423_1458 [Oscillospiraceae bacterium]
MKKDKIIIAAISLCMAASVFTGCNNQTGESAQISRIDGGQTKISVENGNGNNSASGIFTFSYKGYEIVPGAKLGTISKVLGEPENRLEGDSCASLGADLEYYYPGFLIASIKDSREDEDEVAIITRISINDPLIDCNGIHVGQTIDDAKKIYGDPFQEDDFGITYRSGNTKLQINTDGVNTITEINYEYEFN